MALLFSAVTVTANDKKVEFLVGGIPREFSDLEGWTAFERFMEDISEDTTVKVHAEANIYGGEEIVKATPEEIAYFMKRIEMDENFISSRCQNIDKVDFDFTWSPNELFNRRFSKMNDWERQHRQAQELKDEYPPGTRLELICMRDPHHPVEDGTRGTVDHVDDGGNIHMKWDNGRTLSLCPEADEFRRLTQEEIDEELRQQAQEQEQTPSPQEQSMQRAR